MVEIGVYEGASALALLDVLGPDAELHLIDPFGSHPDALPSGWAANEWATRRAVTRAARRRRARADIRWHVALSHEVASHWDREVDLVFIDGDHSEAGCELDWSCGSASSRVGGRVVFHDARAGAPDGRGLPGPTAVVERLLSRRGHVGLGDRRRGRPHGGGAARALTAWGGLRAGLGELEIGVRRRVDRTTRSVVRSRRHDVKRCKGVRIAQALGMSELPSGSGVRGSQRHGLDLDSGDVFCQGQAQHRRRLGKQLTALTGFGGPALEGDFPQPVALFLEGKGAVDR